LGDWGLAQSPTGLNIFSIKIRKQIYIN